MGVFAGTGDLELHPLQRDQLFYQNCGCSTDMKAKSGQVLEVAGLTAAVFVQATYIATSHDVQPL